MAIGTANIPTCYKTGCFARAPYQTLYRVNQRGVDAIWACNEHRIEKDSELDAIIEAIKSGEIKS